MCCVFGVADRMVHGPSLRVLALTGVIGALLSGCGMFPDALTDRECMTRVMYFESNRSSPDGMLAVGTTVMNRLASPKFPKTVCGVVGQPNQFASGVLTKPMNARQSARVAEVADAVLAGARHPQVGDAMYFHTAGLTFPYTNMHYVAVAGGNAFYEKRSMRDAPFRDPPLPASEAPGPADPLGPPAAGIVAGEKPANIDDVLAAESTGSVTPPEAERPPDAVD